MAGLGADDTVLSVVATLPDQRVLVLHQQIGKYTLRDDATDAPATDLRWNKVILNREHLRKIGIIDEAFRLALRFHPTKIKVGQAAEEEQVLYLMRYVFQENKVYGTSLHPRPQTRLEGKKELRIMNTLLPYYETRMVYHDPSLTKLEYQLEYLGKSTHDDCADSLECAFYSLEFPENLSESWFITKATMKNDAPWRIPKSEKGAFDWQTD